MSVPIYPSMRSVAIGVTYTFLPTVRARILCGKLGYRFGTQMVPHKYLLDELVNAPS